MAFSLSYSGSECHGVDPLEQSPVATSFILVSASGLANRQKSLCSSNLPRRHQHDRLSISGEGEGTASTSQSCGEVSTAQGLPSSAYSPGARGRSGRKLGTLQDRTAKDLALAGSTASRPPMISSSRSLSAAAQRPVRHVGRRGERLRGRWFGASRRDPVHRGGAGHGPPATIGCVWQSQVAPAHQYSASPLRQGAGQGPRISERRARGVLAVVKAWPGNTPAHAAPSLRGPSLTAAARAVTESRHGPAA